MQPPCRARRILKWTGAGLLLSIVTDWIVGRWWFFFLVLPSNHHYISFGAGFIGLIRTEYHTPIRVSNGFHYHGAVKWGLEPPQSGVPLDMYGEEHLIVAIPYWLILLMTVIPTVWLWHRDRQRFPPGHCTRCGYDLTGNTSGVCSECGNKVRPPLLDGRGSGRG